MIGENITLQLVVDKVFSKEEKKKQETAASSPGWFRQTHARLLDISLSQFLHCQHHCCFHLTIWSFRFSLYLFIFKTHIAFAWRRWKQQHIDSSRSVWLFWNAYLNALRSISHTGETKGARYSYMRGKLTA